MWGLSWAARCGKLRNSFLVGLNLERHTVRAQRLHHPALHRTLDPSTRRPHLRSRSGRGLCDQSRSKLRSHQSGPSVRTTQHIRCQHASRAARGCSILGDVDGLDDDGLHRLVARHRLHALDLHHDIHTFDHLAKHLPSRKETLRVRSCSTASEFGGWQLTGCFDGVEVSK